MLVVLRGEIQHKNLWLVDLDTRQERPLTNFRPDFNVSDFDISRDSGRRDRSDDVPARRVWDRHAALLQSQLDYVQAANEMDAAIGRQPR